MKHGKEELREQFEKLVSDCEHLRCPECGSDDTGHGHFEGNYSVPETDFLFCYECGYQWGFE